MHDAATNNAEVDTLSLEYELAGERSRQTHFYEVQTKLATHSSRGVLKRVDQFRELLKVEPGNRSDGEPDRCTCAKFYMQLGDDPKVTIPSLDGFSYEVNKDLLDRNDLDEKGQLFGIPEDKFEGLTDHTGAKLAFEAGYQVYSAFFYYHGFTGYAEPTPEGNGVQHLRVVGDKVIHDAAFVESPIPGKLAKASSTWRNGEVTLEFKGLRTIDGKPCAVLGFNSGACAWSMPMTYMPVMNLKTTGVSNYMGDIYLDLDSFWVGRLEMQLFEITTTSMWGISVDKSIPVTQLSIRAISKEEFEQG